ncbi:pyrroline-5-carboxylate reductase [Aeoliella mucimassa]|uniref:Pyrroline-5-carboxylate reductase n=1 Tax=Aeoliella mucimassa TaxID=2527972 RepID=A0A518AL18_9BACT|nr:pyrroline-5-carboxylate reductase [Aeoliella mucimassa]QDU55420.1 Pyrroline-5-carboxylate reductase [Aeoliella mucimassa]
MPQYKYGFIGAGRMASALAGGLVDAGLAAASEIAASDPNAEVRQAFAERLPGAHLHGDNAAVSRHASMLILAVKPQVMGAVLGNLPLGESAPLVVSIAAGVPIAKLEAGLAEGTHVVRVMPNTPALIGRGASGFSGGTHATADDLASVLQLLEAVGIAFEVPESLLDAVTGLSGSGPAFVYTMIEALSDGGVLAGLPRAVAHQLAAQTVSGAAAMVLETGEHPALLREAVASPGGTTIAGLAALEQGSLRSTVIGAVKAAAERSQQLGRN